MSTLKQQAYKGIFWTALDRISNQGLQFIIGIVLARILTPEEFGLVGMITVFIVISNVFIDSGFGLALINKKETNIIEESSVFWLNLIVSILVFVLLYFLSPYIANFYEEPILTDITRVLGLTLVLQALGSIHLNLLTKELDFKTQFRLTLTSKIVSGIVGIGAALYGFGVWALVFQRIVQSFWQSAGLWIFHKWRPKLSFSLPELKPLWGYGSKLLASSLLSTVSDNIYSLVIGKGFSAADLGYYRRAKGYQILPVSLLTSTIGRVSFPIYSKVKDDSKKYLQLMRKSFSLMSFVSFPVLAGLAVMAKPIIIVMITDKWLPSVPYLQLLCIIGMLYPWNLMNVQALVAYGRSDLNLRITIIKNGLRLLNLFVMMNFSVLFIVVGEVFVSLLSILINSYYSRKIFNYGFISQLMDLKRIFLSTSLLVLITLIPLKLELSVEYTLTLQIMIFGVGFILLNRLINKDSFNDLLVNLKKLKSGKT
ncbi:lipopolysaccharide biosynthesis protein [Saccharicrinis sp. FJH54]|uniref:lipopolysaccharide biosynthesis protein n=1 Tax=Saccharicrinis sp. FJH54 TaxID=3344665 RepID=UPI0035D41B3C